MLAEPCFLWKLQERILLCLFQLLVPPGVPGLWLHPSGLYLCLHITLSSVSVSFLLSPKKTLVIGFKINQIIQDDLISRSLTYLHHQRLFLIKSHSQVLGVRIWVYLLGGHRPLPLLIEKFLVHLEAEILCRIQQGELELAAFTTTIIYSHVQSTIVKCFIF